MNVRHELATAGLDRSEGCESSQREKHASTVGRLAEELIEYLASSQR